jgi:hypothetical protein
VLHACNPSSWGGGGRRIESSRPAWAKGNVRLCLKNKIKEKQKGWGVALAQVLHTVLGSILRIIKIKKLKRIERGFRNRTGFP